MSWLLVMVPWCCHRSSLLPTSCYGRGIWKLHTWQQVNTRPLVGTKEYKDSCLSRDTWTKYAVINLLKGKKKICHHRKLVLNKHYHIYYPIFMACITHLMIFTIHRTWLEVRKEKWDPPPEPGVPPVASHTSGCTRDRYANAGPNPQAKTTSNSSDTIWEEKIILSKQEVLRHSTTFMSSEEFVGNLAETTGERPEHGMTAENDTCQVSPSWGREEG